MPETVLLLGAVFALALVESLLIVGLLVPGVGLLLTLTVLAAEAQVPLLWWLLGGSLGAFAGDAISFEIGRYQQEAIQRWSFFQRHPHWLQQGQDFFRRFGGWSIALGRFVGPLRPFVPAVAGGCGMQRGVFYWVNSLSAPLWAIVYLLPMYWLGQEALDYLNVSQLLILLLAASGLALVITYRLRRR